MLIGKLNCENHQFVMILMAMFILLSMQMVQRFGSSSVPTHLIGAALLRGEWKAAVSLILDPREGDILC